MEKNLLGVPPIKREGQTISNDCFEACQGIYMREKIERLRKRVNLLEGYLTGALDVVEGFALCNTKEARKALEGGE